MSSTLISQTNTILAPPSCVHLAPFLFPLPEPNVPVPFRRESQLSPTRVHFLQRSPPTTAHNTEKKERQLVLYLERIASLCVPHLNSSTISQIYQIISTAEATKE
jgi:hypothetical protein